MNCPTCGSAFPIMDDKDEGNDRIAIPIDDLYLLMQGFGEELPTADESDAYNRVLRMLGRTPLMPAIVSSGELTEVDAALWDRVHVRFQQGRTQ